MVNIKLINPLFQFGWREWECVIEEQDFRQWVKFPISKTREEIEIGTIEICSNLLADRELNFTEVNIEIDLPNGVTL